MCILSFLQTMARLLLLRALLWARLLAFLLCQEEPEVILILSPRVLIMSVPTWVALLDTRLLVPL